jgi:putative tricarboxylic transport membrane protein
MIGFGFLGFALKRFSYPVAPVVLGLILRNLLESNTVRVVLLWGNASMFSILTPFLAAALIALPVLSHIRGRKERT